MSSRKPFFKTKIASVVATLAIGPAGAAAASMLDRPVVTTAIDDARTVERQGNIRPELGRAQDLGRVSDAMAFPHLLLQLQRSPERETATRQFIEDLADKHSPNFHNWLTPDEINSRFGVLPQDMQKVRGWLEAHGFKVGPYTPNMVLDVSGDAGKLREAFGVEMHTIMVDGAKHVANTTNPHVPEALREVLVAPVGLNDFKPHADMKRRGDYTYTNSNGTTTALVPGDLQTIYNIKPVYAEGLTGQGQTIVLVEDTDLYTNGDYSAFRKVLGLSRKYPGGNTLTVVHPAPSGGSACSDPGDNGDDSEASLDVEWSSATAPNASIVLASCPSQNSTSPTVFGGFIALQNILSKPNPAQIVSVSYGESEEITGAAGNLYVNNLFQTGVLAGVSIFVSSGDDGASSSDRSGSASHGINVTGWGGTPYNISVGGTDFEDGYLGTTGNYWNSTNASDFSSAKSYIPEIPWNDTCAGQLFWTFVGQASGNAACNNANYASYRATGGGSGGPSSCATGTPATASVSNGTCAGYAKPSWQAGLVGVPNDGVRDLPDVALFASNGFWGHYYVVCYSHPGSNYGGTPCNNNPSTWAGFGGTSVSTPIMAGIQALINQKTGQSWGNANTVYYAIAKSQYGASGNSLCNSNRSGGPDASCDFNDVTVGDMADACIPLTSGTSRTGYTLVGTFNCYGSGASQTLSGGRYTLTYTYGVLSTSNATLQPGVGAYGTTTGWDFATGIGSVNAYNLVNDPAW